MFKLKRRHAKRITGINDNHYQPVVVAAVTDFGTVAVAVTAAAETAAAAVAVRTRPWLGGL